MSLPSSTNYFTRAMELTHMYIPDVTRQERLEAEQYLMTLRATADGLNLSFHIISNEPVHDFRCFWAFNTIIHHLPSLACSIDNTQAEELYRVLFSFIYRYFFSSSTVQRQTMDFLANKHAQMMVVGLQEFFPLRWRSFFDDAFELFTRRETLPHVSDAVTVYLLRLFEYIDERVVSVRAQADRCRELRARDMELKDAMREYVIPRAVATWYVILCDCRIRAPEIANICLGVVQTYIEWVDVALFMTAEWINFLYFLVTAPALRSAACECIFSLVEKKQLPAVKLESLRILNIVDALPRIVSLLQVPPATDEDVNFLEVVARLTRGVAEQFLELYEHVLDTTTTTTTTTDNTKSNSYHIGDNNNINNGNNNEKTSANGHDGGFNKCCDHTNKNDMNGYGLRDGNEQPPPPPPPPQQQQQQANGCLSVDCLKDVSTALDNVVTHLLRLLSINHSDVNSSILPFVQTYAKSSSLREEQAIQLLMTLYDLTKITGLTQDEDQLWLDDIINQRKQIYNLIRLLFSRYSFIVYQHLQTVIEGVTISTGEEEILYCTRTMGDVEYRQGKQHAENTNNKVKGINKSADAVEIEAALRYLYELGESLRIDKLRDASHEFLKLAGVILFSEHIVQCTCAVVHLSYFEVLVRYYTFLIYKKEYIPILLQRFLLLPYGVMNRHHRVRARICYLFGHLVQLLKTNLLPHKENIVNALLSIFSSNVLLPSDRRELYEAVGNLLSVTPSTSVGKMNGESMIMQVIQTVTQCLSSASSSTATVPSVMSSEVVGDNISFLSALAKGLRGGHNTNNSGDVNNGVVFVDIAVGDMFHDITRDVMDMLTMWHMSPSVRDYVAQYFTQMVHTLPFESMEVYFSAYITNWLMWMETIPELTKLLRLLLQFIHCNGAKVETIFATLLPLVLQKLTSVGELFISSTEMGVMSESTREKRDVYRQFFSLLQGATQSGYVHIIISLSSINLHILLSRLLSAIQLPGETELTKLALQILTKIITTQWENDEDINTISNCQNNIKKIINSSTTTTTINSSTTSGNWLTFILYSVIPAILERLTLSSFELKDAKNFILIGETGILLKALMDRLGPNNSSLCICLYTWLQPIIGEEETTEFVTTLQKESRFSTEMRMRFCYILQLVKERQGM